MNFNRFLPWKPGTQINRFNLWNPKPIFNAVILFKESLKGNIGTMNKSCQYQTHLIYISDRSFFLVLWNRPTAIDFLHWVRLFKITLIQSNHLALFFSRCINYNHIWFTAIITALIKLVLELIDTLINATDLKINKSNWE